MQSSGKESLSCKVQNSVRSCLQLCLGTIHVLLNHKRGEEGVSQMLRWEKGEGLRVRGRAYVIIVWKKMLNNLHYLFEAIFLM